MSDEGSRFDAHSDFDPLVGLCSVCKHAGRIEHPRGGRPYYRCTLAEKDPRFEKFPAVPVRFCPGFEQKTVAD